jgi:UDP-N-acetylglucosamine 2-epimerase
MKKLKIITVVGTRPEIIRLSRVISKLDIFCDHIIVHTGQNYDYELNQIFFNDLKLRKPDYFLNSAEDSVSPSNTIGNIIISFDKILDQISPDALLVLGDTNSCLSVIPAKRRKIPIFHIEAGNRCFDQRVPEEINRKIVDHTADINLTYSDISRNYLLSEGISPDMVIKVGSPMLEVINYFKNDINKSSIVTDLALDTKKFFLVSAHREENIDNLNNFKKFIDVLNFLENKYSYPVIVSTHPRTRSQIESQKIKISKNIKLLKPLGFFDYISLQLKSKAVLSDSGTITEESSILNLSSLNIRETNERPEGMEEGAVMMPGLETERIEQCLNILDSSDVGASTVLKIVSDYNTDNVSEKVLRIIHSYTDYVKRVVWKK